MADEDHDDPPRLSAAPSGASAGTAAAPTASEPTPRGPARLPAFFRASWAELQRVRWPDRVQVAQGTGVVLVFVAIFGALLGGVDKIASEIVKAII